MSINEKALLVKLSLSQWYNKAIDRKVTDEIAQRYEVTEQEDKYVKTLLPRVAVRTIQRAISDLRTSMEQFTRIERRMCQLLARHTGKTADEIEAACRLDFWMTPEEALDFGIIDRVARPDTAKFASGRHSRK